MKQIKYSTCLRPPLRWVLTLAMPLDGILFRIAASIGVIDVFVDRRDKTEHFAAKDLLLIAVAVLSVVVAFLPLVPAQTWLVAMLALLQFLLTFWIAGHKTLLTIFYQLCCLAIIVLCIVEISIASGGMVDITLREMRVYDIMGKALLLVDGARCSCGFVIGMRVAGDDLGR